MRNSSGIIVGNGPWPASWRRCRWPGSKTPDGSGPSPWNRTEQYLAGFHEKVQAHRTSSGWLNAGAYVIERELLSGYPPGVPCSLERDIFPAAIADGMQIAAYRCPQEFFDIGTGDDYRRFCQLYRSWIEDPAAGHDVREAG